MILGQPVWYWLIFLAVAVFAVGVPLCAWLEDRADARDRELWRRIAEGPR